MTGQFRVFGAPGRYIQGPGVIETLADLVRSRNARVAVVADEIVMELLQDTIRKTLTDAGHSVTFVEFGGECTAAEIDGMASQADGIDVVIGAGGGKAIDTAKGLSIAIGCPVVIVPTIASNDSPTSRLAVLYDEQHAVSGVRMLERNPDAVLVDSRIIARAPVRFLIAGIGDALSKTFEAAQCRIAGGQTFQGGVGTLAAGALADCCYETIRRNAAGALKAAERGEPDEALENVLEANVLMSGLGFENGGLSVSHAMIRGLSALPEIAHKLHGEMVAYSLLVQLRLEGREQAFIAELVEFYHKIGLPRSLKELGLSEMTPETIETIARLTMQAPYIVHFCVPLDEAAIADAISAIEDGSA